MIVRQIQSDPRAREKPCLRCCTSLRAHLDDRYCPECGLSVWLSLNSNDALDSSRPSWLRAAARASWGLAFIQPLALIAWLMVFVGSMSAVISDFRIEAGLDDEQLVSRTTTRPATQQAVGLPQGFPEHTVEPTSALGYAGLAVGGVYFILNAIGLFALTVEERRYPDKQRGPRLATRVTAGATALVGVVLLVGGIPALLGRTGGRDFGSGLSLLSEFAFAASAICLWLYLRPLATRGHRAGLRRVTSWLLFLPLIGFAKAAPFLGLWFLYLLLPFAHLLPLVYVPVSVVLLILFAIMFRRAAPEAEQTWAAETRARS